MPMCRLRLPQSRTVRPVHARGHVARPVWAILGRQAAASGTGPSPHRPSHDLPPWWGPGPSPRAPSPGGVCPECVAAEPAPYHLEGAAGRAVSARWAGVCGPGAGGDGALANRCQWVNTRLDHRVAESQTRLRHSRGHGGIQAIVSHRRPTRWGSKLSRAQRHPPAASTRSQDRCDLQRRVDRW
jgi:hypothetical protein